MSGGRTMWLATDVERHRRALMVELQDDFGTDALAVDVVLCAKAKLQNDDGAIRDGFASIARESGGPHIATTRAREVIERMGAIGWIDDLEIDPDGRRFRCRMSGWKNDQDRAYAAWRKREQRAGDQSPKPGSNGDKSPKRPKCPPTAQDSTEENIPPTPPAGGRARDMRDFDQDVQAYASRLGISGEDGWRNVKGAIVAGATTNDEVIAFLREWRPDLVGPRGVAA